MNKQTFPDSPMMKLIIEEFLEDIGIEKTKKGSYKFRYFEATSYLFVQFIRGMMTLEELEIIIEYRKVNNYEIKILDINEADKSIKLEIDKKIIRTNFNRYKLDIVGKTFFDTKTKVNNSLPYK